MVLTLMCDGKTLRKKAIIVISIVHITFLRCQQIPIVSVGINLRYVVFGGFSIVT